jgi:hypothetical protein
MTEREIERSVSAARLADKLYEEGLHRIHMWEGAFPMKPLAEIQAANEFFMASDFVRRGDRR